MSQSTVPLDIFIVYYLNKKKFKGYKGYLKKDDVIWQMILQIVCKFISLLFSLEKNPKKKKREWRRKECQIKKKKKIDNKSF